MSAKNHIDWIKKLTALLGVAGASALLSLPAVGQIKPNFSISNKAPYSRTRLAQLPTAASQSGTPLRYLAINVGNANVPKNCWEYKLCVPGVVNSVRNYIATWKPDVIMLSEVFAKQQLKGSIPGIDPANANPNASKSVPGPILPDGYDGICGRSLNPNTTPASPYASGSSHEHECIAWKTSRVSLAPGAVPGTPKSAYGSVADRSCDYDFTGFRVKLLLNGNIPLTAVAIHPQSGIGANTCRIQEIGRYWQFLANGDNVIIGGDWNTDSLTQLQIPPTFKDNYSFGNHWTLATHPNEYSAEYGASQITPSLVKKQFDHAFSNFGTPCTTCGAFYGTANLTFGSALGSYDGHPRADATNGNTGLDHRQILVDMLIDPVNTP